MPHHWLSVIRRISFSISIIGRLTDRLSIGDGVLLIWLSINLWVLRISLEDDSGSLCLVGIIHILSSNFFLQPFLLSLSVAIACNKDHEYCGEDAPDDNTSNSACIGSLMVIVIAATRIVGTKPKEIAAVVEAVLVNTVRVVTHVPELFNY